MIVRPGPSEFMGWSVILEGAVFAVGMGTKLGESMGVLHDYFFTHVINFPGLVIYNEPGMVLLMLPGSLPCREPVVLSPSHQHWQLLLGSSLVLVLVGWDPGHKRSEKKWGGVGIIK